MTPARLARRLSRRLSQRQALVLLVLLLAGTVVLLELLGSGYHRTLGALTLINVMLAVSLTMTNGFTGLFSLGHPAFMTLGAYVAIAFTYPAARKSFAMPDLPAVFSGIEWPLPVAALIAALAAAAAA
ncbi:MAG: hypothetical protein WD100_00165, partial [Tistlia sp.]